jgi:programmed cell death 6-interacting protein
MDSFLHSRRQDSSVKEREHALQSLDLSYHKYKEVVRHLDDGMQFYNDLAGMLIKFKESCLEWAMGRRSELRSITDSVNEITLEDDDLAQFTAPVSPPAPEPEAPLSTPQSPRPSRQIALDLPPPDSDQWETMEMPPPPPTRRINKQRKK